MRRRKLRIMVVDDDPDIREIMALVLDAEGLEVVAASSGTEALELLGNDPSVALLVLDLMMPGMSGPELVKQLRQDPGLGRIPIVILSGDVHGPDVARELGGLAYLGKPVELGALTRTVNETLARAPQSTAPASSL